MIDIRKALWGSALLVAFAGCNTEEPSGVNPPAPPPTVPGGPSPEGMPPPAAPEKADEAKPKEEMPPPKAEDAKPEPAPAKEEEKLKLEAPKATDAEKKADASPAKEALSSEEVAEIEKLPAADKDLALAQVLCPVSGEHLGSMGKPLKVSAEGKTFLLCCKGCTEDVTNDPKAVVAKLSKK